MYIDIRLDQGQALTQQLHLAPQLLNWLRLLQCPTTELSAMVARELETNPALEAEAPASDAQDTASSDADLESDRAESEMEQASPSSGDDLEAKIEFLCEIENEWKYDRYQTRRAASVSREDQMEKHQFIMDSLLAPDSLQEHLLRQVSTLNLRHHDHLLAQLIIGSLDDRGYLVTSLPEIAELAGSSMDGLDRVLACVQGLDPSGVGARDLAECLLLQMDRRHEPDFLPALIVREHVDALAAHDFAGMAQALHVTAAEIQAAAAFIATLDPSPGLVFNARPVEYVSPDVIVSRQDGELVIQLNEEHLPQLRISEACRQMLGRKDLAQHDRAYIRGKLRTASFLIQGIGQRQETLRKVAREILRSQADFFHREGGELRPLTMAKVASVLGVHETTVSRALANKYMETPRGVFEMKHFFRSGYLCGDGTALTPEAVKSQIKELIDRENPRQPLTDLDVVEQLGRKGLQLARRTIAKYRDEMGIAASKQRKRHVMPSARVVRITEAIPFPAPAPHAGQVPLDAA